jgi:hypothetical protein
MKIELVSKELTGWFGRTKTMYAIRRDDDQYKDLIYKAFSHRYWCSDHTKDHIWNNDLDFVQSVFAFLTGEKAAHNYKIIRTGVTE